MISAFIPTPKALQTVSSPYDLKERLDWGEPALTIIDVRSHDDFKRSHITGAVSIPMSALSSVALSTLEYERDIYVYGETDVQTADAASVLREVGFERVAELKEGISGWAAIKGSVDS